MPVPSRTESLAKILRAGHIMSTPGKYQKWEEDTYKRFDIRKVEFWPDAKAQQGRSVSFRSIALTEEDRGDRSAKSSPVKVAASAAATSVPDDFGILSDGDEHTYTPSTFAEDVSDTELPELPPKAASALPKAIKPSKISSDSSKSSRQLPSQSLVPTDKPASNPQKHTTAPPARTGTRQLPSKAPISIDIDSSDNDDIEILAVLDPAPP